MSSSKTKHGALIRCPSSLRTVTYWSTRTAWLCATCPMPFGSCFWHWLISRTAGTPCSANGGWIHGLRMEFLHQQRLANVSLSSSAASSTRSASTHALSAREPPIFATATIRSWLISMISCWLPRHRLIVVRWNIALTHFCGFWASSSQRPRRCAPAHALWCMVGSGTWAPCPSRSPSRAESSPSCASCCSRVSSTASSLWRC